MLREIAKSIVFYAVGLTLYFGTAWGVLAALFALSPWDAKESPTALLWGFLLIGTAVWALLLVRITKIRALNRFLEWIAPEHARSWV